MKIILLFLVSIKGFYLMASIEILSEKNIMSLHHADIVYEKFFSKNMQSEVPLLIIHGGCNLCQEPISMKSSFYPYDSAFLG